MTEQNTEKQVCGIVMPISATDGCGKDHWAEVLQIISDTVDSAGLEANLVSEADDVGSIHKRIVQNLYENPIVVCDVSAKNPNVMFELGMRLAFDKPTIIIKDDKTSYSFDTSTIEHLEYPRDLRFSTIVTFKETLTRKISSTLDKFRDDSATTFLKHFGEFKVAKISTKEVGAEEIILEELTNIKKQLGALKSDIYRGKSSPEFNYISSLSDSIIRKKDPDQYLLNLSRVSVDARHQVMEYALNDSRVKAIAPSESVKSENEIFVLFFNEGTPVRSERRFISALRDKYPEIEIEPLFRTAKSAMKDALRELDSI
ncbi:hypothetical protein KFE80_02915 [bacterium SCSIO 12696]|nr:hypothetical protein KFE80_02915 [bacterium SCSIO 12696]